VLRCFDRRTGSAHVLAVRVGTKASLGRGGDPAVTWWLEPDPYDSHQHSRLSRQHVFLELREGRAWAWDQSTNGTWLNNETLAKAPGAMLADDDMLEPARVMTLGVRLFGDTTGVHSVCLERRDALAGRLAYLLADGRHPSLVRLGADPSPAAWVAWLDAGDGTPQLAFYAGQDAGWNKIAANEERLVANRYRVSWQAIATPMEQCDYLENAI
jgi:hypothetical protein